MFSNKKKSALVGFGGEKFTWCQTFFFSLIYASLVPHTLTGLQYAEVWRLMSAGAYVNWRAVSLWSMMCFFYWLDNKIILTRQKCLCVNLFSPWKEKRSGVLVLVVMLQSTQVQFNRICEMMWGHHPIASSALWILQNPKKLHLSGYYTESIYSKLKYT